MSDIFGRYSADLQANQKAPLSACRTTSRRRLGPIYLPKMMIPVRYHVWSGCDGENDLSLWQHLIMDLVYGRITT